MHAHAEAMPQRMIEVFTKPVLVDHLSRQLVRLAPAHSRTQTWSDVRCKTRSVILFALRWVTSWE